MCASPLAFHCPYPYKNDPTTNLVLIFHSFILRAFSVLGSRLDTDTHTTSCRLAFHGSLSYPFEDKDYSTADLTHFKVYKTKSKEGVVERASNECELICKGMFKKETNLPLFQGLKVTLSTGEAGVIAESFGQSGKFKVRVPGKTKWKSYLDWLC